MSNTNSSIWPFSKMHGIGNDYVYFNCLEREFPTPEIFAPLLADRHFGIGGDGIVLICNSSTEDFKMQMHNSDGSEAEMCGNAVRCVGKYLFDNGYTDKSSIRLETKAGTKVLELETSGGKVHSVRVDMGAPVLIPSEVPVALKDNEKEAIVNEPFSVKDFAGSLTCVSMGNPHAVFFVEEVLDSHVHTIGPIIETHEAFPNRTNVEFVKVISEQELEMRVWERGAGETLACGTGAAAVCVAGVLNGLCDSKVKVRLLGGTLELEWDKDGSGHVFKTGPASLAFEGTVDLELFSLKR